MITTIGQLFDIVYGQKEYHNKEWLQGTRGKNILISSKGEDNGVYGFYNIISKFKAPVITVQGYGTIGQAFVQEYDCAVDDHLLILIPKQKMELDILYSIAYQIRLTKWKYKYGRGITPDRLKTQRVSIIKNSNRYKDLNKKLLPKINKKIKIIPNKNIKLLKVADIFNIERKTASPQNIYLEGKTPYVTTSSLDNGVSMFVEGEPNFTKKCLTVSLNGSVCEVFLQTDKFITSSDNAILTLKDKYNPYLLIYMGALIKTHQWKYSFYRKMSMEKLKNILIPLPFKNNKIDLDYIQKICKNSYGFNELKPYL